jgi:exportin-5
MPVLRVDAHVTIIDAALKGYLKWLAAQGSDPTNEVCRLSKGVSKANGLQDRMRSNMEEIFEQWCRQLLQARFEVWAIDRTTSPY